MIAPYDVVRPIVDVIRFRLPLIGKRLVAAFVVGVLGSIFHYVQAASSSLAGSANLTVGDFVVALFVGRDEFIPDVSPTFYLPAGWLLLCGLVCFVALPSDSESPLVQRVLLVGSRRAWWIGECAWAVLATLAACASVLLGVVLAGAVLGVCWTLELTDGSAYVLGLSQIASALSPPLAARVLMLIPVVFLALVFIQLFVSTFTGPIVAFISTISILFLSVFYLSPLWLGNYLMAARLDPVIDNGVRPIDALPLSALVVAGCFAAGVVLVRYREFGIKKGVGTNDSY